MYPIPSQRLPDHWQHFLPSWYRYDFIEVPHLEEAEKVLNDYHSGACGGHLSGYATAQIILRAGYFWPTIFKDCIITVRSCHEC